MGYLKDARCYLGGPIENESGPDWRIDVKKALTEFEINLFDPAADPKQVWAPRLRECRVQKDYEGMAKIAKAFVRKDLGRVDRSDFVISYVPHKVPTTGTHHEIIVSHEAKKPTLLVCPQGKELVPAWYFGFIPTEFMFGSWDALYEYLREVDRGEHKEEYRWAFVYGLI